MKKLTRRQQEFLNRFLDVYFEGSESLHYTVVAKRLGISNVTAYEMLRLLEERGLVEAHFYLPEGSHGPGRSTVLFRPTAEANRLLQEFARKGSEENDWETTREAILEQLETGKLTGYESLLNNLLARISERRSPLVFTTEMVTAVILSVSMLKDNAVASGLKERLKCIGLPGEISLSALAGIGSALSLAERTNRQVANFLINESERYQAMLVQMGEDNRRRVSEFAREVAKIINA
jgi:DNA-binding PadR family transcriptional regulator